MFFLIFVVYSNLSSEKPFYHQPVGSYNYSSYRGRAEVARNMQPIK